MKYVALLVLCTTLQSCSLYRSSDRDDFDKNGKARAPAGAGLLGCAPAENPSGDSLISLTQMDAANWEARAQISKQICVFQVDTETAGLPSNLLLARFRQLLDVQP